MTEYEIVGIEEIKFPDEKTGEFIHGRRLHLTFDFDDGDGKEGIGVLYIKFLKTERAFNAKTGDIVNVLYNQYGKVADILVLDK